jgi:hypothetical protein
MPWYAWGVIYVHILKYLFDRLVVCFYPLWRVPLGGLVRTLSYLGLVILLSVALIGIPTMAMPASPASAPLGMVLQAERARGGADTISGGATIYEGDRLETQDDGTLRARLGGSQMYLRPGTATEVHGLPNGFSASLMRGTVVASSPEGQTFRLLANGVTIHPAGTQATVAEVTWVNPTELVLTSNRGAIEVSMGDEVKTIEAGSSYRMEIQQPDGAAPSPQGSGNSNGPVAPGRRRRLAFFLLFGGIAVGTGYGIWRAVESPSGM